MFEYLQQKKNRGNKSGLILPTVLVFTGVSVVIVIALTSWFAVTIQAARTHAIEEQAFHIAEAGIDYYRWHLAHDPNDYQDGNPESGTGPAEPEGEPEVVEEDIQPNQDGLMLWVDASDINDDGSETSDQTNIDEWKDKSPQNNHLKKSGNKSVPKKVTDLGNAGVMFEGDILITKNKVFKNTPVTDADVFLVARVRNDGDNAYTFDTNGTTFALSLPWGNGDTRFDFGNTSSGRIETNFTESNAQPYMWNFQSSETLGKMIRRDSVEIISESQNAPASNNPKKMTVGGDKNASDTQDITIHEMLIYDRTLNPEERDVVEKYLDCKWVITSRDDCGNEDEPGTTYGPFVHDFFDKDGEKIGEFELYITSPPFGSSVVTVQSTGRILNAEDESRTIRTKLAIPSFVKFAFAADSTMRFGEGTEVFGPIHSNGGIRFDGVAHNVVTSARESYDDPDHSGSYEYGVHTHISPVDPNPPAAVPVRNDVFKAGRTFPVPAIDFSGMISNLSDIKDQALAGGKYFAPSGANGYKIVLKADDTFDIYRVDAIFTPHWSCNNAQGDSDWGTWSIQNDDFIATHNNPGNGVIFIEDHLWVEGQIDTARLTIAAARFPDTPSTRRNIIINNNLEYTNYDGQDTLALIAQNNVNVGLVSQDILRVDAALIAQSGRIGRHYYRPSYYSGGWQPGCDPYHERDTITLLGTIGSKERYGFAWSDNTGYDIRNITYDPNLLFSPPPSFPLTSDQFETILWEEVN